MTSASTELINYSGFSLQEIQALMEQYPEIRVLVENPYLSMGVEDTSLYPPKIHREIVQIAKMIRSGRILTLGSNILQAGQSKQFVDIIKAQGMSEIILRINAFSDWSSGRPSASTVSVAKSIITDAKAVGIDVSIDLHTWYTTWDNSFRDSASNSASNRSTYLNFIRTAISTFDGYDVKAWMVLNEPQARSASSSENQFIRNCISAAKERTSKPVSVRFMCGYSSSTGHYASDIDDLAGFKCVNTYWDPRNPGSSVYGTTQAKMDGAISAAHSRGKELWITEFGKNKSNQIEQRDYVRAFVSYAKDQGTPNISAPIDRIFCWVSQPVGGSGESYNIFNGWTPLPAFYELKSDGVTPPPVQYTLTMSSSGSGSTAPSSGYHIYNEGTVVPVSATPLVDWLFDHWVLDGSAVQSLSSVTMNSNHALQAIFVQIPPPDDPCKPWKDQIVSLQVEIQDLNDENSVLSQKIFQIKLLEPDLDSIIADATKIKNAIKNL